MVEESERFCFIIAVVEPFCVVCRVTDDSVHVLFEDDGRFIISAMLRWVKVSHTLTVIRHFWFLLVGRVSVALIVLAFSPTFAFSFALLVGKFSFAFLTSFSFVELRVVLCEPALIVIVTTLIVVIVVWFSRPVFVWSASAFAFDENFLVRFECTFRVVSFFLCLVILWSYSYTFPPSLGPRSESEDSGRSTGACIA